MRHVNGTLIRNGFLFALAIAWPVSDVAAQSKSLFGSSSILGSSSGSATGGAAGSTGTGFGSTGSATGGFGSTTGTTGGFGTTSSSTTGGLGIQRQGMVGTNTQAGGAGNRFVGQTQTGAQGQGQLGGQNRQGQNQLGLGATGQAGRGQQTGRGRNGQQNQPNMQGQGQMGARGRTGTAKSILRPQQRVAFEYDLPTISETQSTLSARYTGKAGSQAALQGVDVAIGDGGVVTLRGTVESDDARKLATILARLEPGVKTVQDELVVQPKAKESR